MYIDGPVVDSLSVFNPGSLCILSMMMLIVVIIDSMICCRMVPMSRSACSRERNMVSLADPGVFSN